MIHCANPMHPDGPWHTAQPLPYSWQLIQRAKQAIRRRLWGCGCPPKGASA